MKRGRIHASQSCYGEGSPAFSQLREDASRIPRTLPMKIVLTFAALCLSLALQAAAPQKPNIMIILADDLGWSDLGCYGGEIHTPNLDALAAGGVGFQQFYNFRRCVSCAAALLHRR